MPSLPDTDKAPDASMVRRRRHSAPVVSVRAVEQTYGGGRGTASVSASADALDPGRCVCGARRALRLRRKSTLVCLMAGFERGSSGEVEVFGAQPRGRPPGGHGRRRPDLGPVPHGLHRVPDARAAADRAVSSNPDAYVYLAESIRAWPDQPGLAALLQKAGWSKVAWRNLTGGVVALHRATRA
ncbi:2-methoxy-6-polyprenyl-1,4-benzoquinol methylase, mitochondrial [Streptomyces microflavus]